MRRRLRRVPCPLDPHQAEENNEIYYRVGGWFCARLCSFLAGHGKDATGVVGQDSTGHQVVPKVWKPAYYRTTNLAAAFRAAAFS